MLSSVKVEPTFKPFAEASALLISATSAVSRSVFRSRPLVSFATEPVDSV